MGFLLKMAWRDSRASRRRLLLYSLSIVLGIAALVAIGSFAANLEQAIREQAKGLLGADLVVTSRQPMTPAIEAHLAGLAGEVSREAAFSSMIVFPEAAGRMTRLVQVRAIEGGFPFYGEFQTEPAAARGQLHGASILVEETLLHQFGAKLGDTVKLGRSEFRVTGIVKKIPGESPMVAQFAARVFIPLAELPATGLAGEGSLVRHRRALRLPEGIDPQEIVRELRRKFSQERLSFDTVEERQRQMGRTLKNVNSFLGLVGFVALFLGAIGVGSAMHVFVRQKITTVAVLRCLGATAGQGFAIYVVQGLALGLFGALLGAALGVLTQLALPAITADLLPFKVDFFVSWAAVARGMGSGLVVCVLFTLLPLLEIRRVSPLVALRAAWTGGSHKRDPWRLALGLFIAGAVIGFAVWQTRSWRMGLGFAAMLGTGFLLLAGAARAVMWTARRALPRTLPYVVRQGVANLHRPNNRTLLLLLSLGLGTFLILSLYLTRGTLLGQIGGAEGGDRPNLLFFDVQDDQIGPLGTLLAAEGAPIRQQAPIVTMRISKVKGRPVEILLKDRPAGIPPWTLRREYRSTYRGVLTDTEKLVGGKFTGRVEAGSAIVPVSVEEGLAKDLQVGLGDEIEFDVQGVPMRTRVASLREVDWRRMQANFFMVFPEGVLEEAPKFFVAATRADSPEASARLQQAVVRAMPNVSAIDLTLVLETLDGVFEKVAYVVRFMALFTVATGLIVLAGAVLTGRYQRIRETVLLRTLGASRRQLIGIQFVEYAVLGGLAGLIGAGLAAISNVLLARFVFETQAVMQPAALAGAVGGVMLITLATGLLADRGVAEHPPLEVLRQEG